MAFYDANFDYCIKISDKIQQKDKHIINLLNNISENKKVLKNLENIQLFLTDMENEKEIIEFTSLIISTIFVKKELEKLYDEIEKLNKQK
jgi:ATP/maltotriose-dependent transcriptional regulator MalT